MDACPATSSSLDPSKQSRIPDVEDLPTLDSGRPEYDLPRCSRLERTLRFSGCAERRRRVYVALRETGQTSARINRFATCGSRAYVEVNAKHEVRLACNRCRDRFCPVCAAERGARIGGRLAELIRDLHPRFVTLTLKSNALELTDQISRIYNCFSQLRRRRLWKDHVKGGAAVCEIKLGRTGAWHVHLHCLVTGRYFAQKDLSEEWYKATGDSSIVDIRAVDRNTTGVDLAKYLAKYIAKPMSHEIFTDPEKMRAMISALHGRRLCLTWGCWRGEKLDQLSDEADTGEWKSCGPLETVVERAKGGDEECRRIFDVLCRKYPILLRYQGYS